VHALDSRRLDFGNHFKSGTQLKTGTLVGEVPDIGSKTNKCHQKWLTAFLLKEAPGAIGRSKKFISLANRVEKLN
jgi:hypothetical protein